MGRGLAPVPYELHTINFFKKGNDILLLEKNLIDFFFYCYERKENLLSNF